jgi:hypothetical protein
MEEVIMNGIKSRMHPDGSNMTFQAAVDDLCFCYERIMKLIEVSASEAIIEAVKSGRKIKVNCFGEIVSL